MSDRLLVAGRAGSCGLLLALVLALAACGCGDDDGPLPTPADEPTPPPPAVHVDLTQFDGAAIDAWLLEQAEAQQQVGIAVAIARGDTVIYLGGAGLEDLGEGVPVDPRATLFRWASVAKGFAGVAALQAQQAGDVSLDDAVSQHLPGYTAPATWLPGDCTELDCAEPLPGGAPTVTLRQLLTHTSGVQHYENGAVNPVPPLTLTDAPESNTGIEWALDWWTDAPFAVLPGETYSYSTFGFNLAGVVLERSTGHSYDELVQSGIAAPLGMSTLQPDHGWVTLPRQVTGYWLSGGDPFTDGHNDVSWKLPGGGYVSTVEDFARWCSGLMGEGLLPTDLRDDVLWATGDVHPDYGLGFGIGGEAGDRRVSHTGGQQSTRTALLLRPDEGDGDEGDGDEGDGDEGDGDEGDGDGDGDGDDGVCFVAMTAATWVAPWPLVQGLRDQYEASTP